MQMPKDILIVLFDGDCGLCNGFIRLIVRQDPQGNKFGFAPLQSEFAKNFVTNPEELAGREGTLVLVKNGKIYYRSEAALQAARHLGGWYRLFGVFSILPTEFRDKCYNWVSRNRNRMFGKANACMLPSRGLRMNTIDPQGDAKL